MLRIRSLGTVSYAEANDLQHSLAAGSADDYLLLLQHPHVYTLGSNADPSHMLVDPMAAGATMEHTDRGGDITYHGPGQLVAYPIISVLDDPAAGPAHVHRLEELNAHSRTLVDLGLTGASTDVSLPGVWIGADGPNPRARSPPMGSARSETSMADAAHSMVWRSMLTATLPCLITSCPAASSTGV